MLENKDYELLNGDCLELMKDIPNKSIDMILCDLPYGTTACKWDTIIPFEPLWEQYNRIIKDNGAIVLFGAEPFSSMLRMSNLKMYKYDWVWCKSRALGFTNAKNKPMNKHELISVFSKGTCANGSKNKMIYNPQGLIPYGKEVSGIKDCKADREDGGHKFARKSHKEHYVQEYTNYPTQLLEFSNEGKTVHPTQKPIALLEYLIKTYTNEGEVILDNCMGSGSTGVACINTNRKFIGIELDEKYFEIARNRIQDIESNITYQWKLGENKEHRKEYKTMDKTINKKDVELNIVYRNIKELKPYKKNAKKHPKEQVERIANSIKEFGFTQPVIIDSNNCVVAGHGRILGAKKAGLKQVPTVMLEDLTEEQIKAYRLVDNKLNESDWDFSLLDEELENLTEDVDMDLFGFDLAEEIEQEEVEKVEFEKRKIYKLVVEFENKKASEKLYKKLSSEGYICRIK